MDGSTWTWAYPLISWIRQSGALPTGKTRRWICVWTRETKKTATDIVNEYSEMELYRIIRDYGEDRFAKNIAKHIVKARQEKRIETTDELVEIIKAAAIPARVNGPGRPPGQAHLPGHPHRAEP